MSNPKNPDYPKPTSKAVTNVMRANKRVDTKPEVAIRSQLHRIGLRFRKDFFIKVNGKSCRPDIVFRKAKLAIFVDGCFWRLSTKHGYIPISNTHYWEPKLKRNRYKDRADTKLLKESGWHVLRLWEHVPMQEAVDIIAKKVSTLKNR